MLFAAAATLADRLRSIFVPYFRYLLDPAVAALEAGGVEQPSKPAKKKRRKSADAEAEPALAPADAAAEENSWRLRTQVRTSTLRSRVGFIAEVCRRIPVPCISVVGTSTMLHAQHADVMPQKQALVALEQLFVHDSVGFLDEARFQRLLPPLVAQLQGGPPPGAAPALAALLPPGLLGAPADAAAAAQAVPDARADPFGAAAVAALSRMAGAAGSDVMYRPLNRAVRAGF